MTNFLRRIVMQLGSRFLVILIGWLTVPAFLVGMVSIVNAETNKMNLLKFPLIKDMQGFWMALPLTRGMV